MCSAWLARFASLLHLNLERNEIGPEVHVRYGAGCMGVAGFGRLRAWNKDQGHGTRIEGIGRSPLSSLQPFTSRISTSQPFTSQHSRGPWQPSSFHGPWQPSSFHGPSQPGMLSPVAPHPPSRSSQSPPVAPLPVPRVASPWPSPCTAASRCGIWTCRITALAAMGAGRCHTEGAAVPRGECIDARGVA